MSAGPPQGSGPSGVTQPVEGSVRKALRARTTQVFPFYEASQIFSWLNSILAGIGVAVSLVFLPFCSTTRRRHWCGVVSAELA